LNVQVQTKTWTFKKTFKVDDVASKIGVRRGAATQQVAADPPGGGCAGDTVYHVTAYYVENILTDSVTDHNSEVYCTPLQPGEAMAHLSVLGELYITGRVHDRAELAECDNCNYPGPSGKRAYCVQPGQVCSGTYYSRETVTMLLPTPWYWTGPPWSDCIMSGPSQEYPTEAMCFVNATTSYIPPTYS
jgi:hypothetical protein